MAVTIEQVADALDSKGYTYRKLDSEHLLVGLQNEALELELFVVLEENGTYLSVQTLELARVRTDNPNFRRVLELLAHANERFKLLKFGWNSVDGEITIETRLPLADNEEITTDQVHRLVGIFPPICGQVWPDVQKALAGYESPSMRLKATGTRPSEQTGRRPPWLMIGIIALLVVVAVILALKVS